MRGTALAIAFWALALACMPAPAALAEVLITKEEASLPASPNVGMTMRGLTRGPGIEQMSPKPNQQVTSPLPFKVHFQVRNQIAIDPATVKLTYLKAKPVDLTERIRKHLKPDGIEMSEAEVPPGTHMLRLDLKDQKGRVATAILKLTVAGK